MGYYRWDGNGDFRDSQNDRTIAPGEVVELSSRVVGNHDFTEVDEPPGDADTDGGEDGGDEPPECDEDGCSRTVKGGGYCWQHEDDE